MLVSFVASGCGKTVGEKAAEKSLEQATGGKANVDISDDKVSVETEAGSWQAGENISLPSDWPDDIHVADGKVTASSVNDFGHSLTVMSDKSPSDLKKEYQEKLEEDSWDITMTMDMGGNVLLGAEKDERSLSISIGTEDDGKTSLVIVEGKK